MRGSSANRRRLQTAGLAAALAVILAAHPRLLADQPAPVDIDPRLGTTVREVVTEFYAGRDPRPVWLSGAARDVALDLLSEAAHAPRYGLCSAMTRPLALHLRLLDTHPDAAGARVLDVDVTEAIAAFLLQVGLGRHTIATGETLSTRVLNVGSLLEQAAIGRPARDILDVAQPRHPEYARLRDALARYRALADTGWRALPGDLSFHPDEPAPAPIVEAIAERLRITGDFNGDLVASIRRFQNRHGLLVDGIVGPQTLRALNAPVESRIEQLAINLDRWRRLPDDLGDRHVRVNIPAFHLEVVEHGHSVLAMRTVVGSAANQTPVFSDRIRYLEFNPYWNVPVSITREELAPRVAEDPGYLAERGFEVLEGWHEGAERIDPAAVDWEAERFSYRLRQLPGPDNALGLVKFMFPNRYSVYLHDTPARHLFASTRRARSHGCVRVEQPAALAAVLLQDSDTWPRTRIEQAMHADERRVVRLPEPVPVHLLYFTAWVDEAGDVQFRRDVYGRDARAAEWFGCES